MRYNPEKHNRKSTRLKGHDYSSKGIYLITICTHNRECFLGHISEKKMILNDIGTIALEFLKIIPDHFPGSILKEQIVMPNHIHLILALTTSHHDSRLNQFSKPVSGSVSVIVQQYKASVRRWCNQNGYGYFQWQRGFYDHIIKDELSFHKLRKYIQNNPVKWNEDKYFV